MTLLLPGMLLAMHSPVLFGGAKPVPVNPLYFKNPRYGIVLVAIAGPLTNILLALASFGLVVLANRSTFIQQNVPAPILLIILMWCLTGVLTNLVLALFNLIPVPPLDGGKIAMGLLPHSLAVLLSKLENFGLLIMFLLLSSGTVSSYLYPVINFATTRLCSELYAGESVGSCPLLQGNFEGIEERSTTSEKAPAKKPRPRQITEGTQGTQI
jgi:Zn-dependent protease